MRRAGSWIVPLSVVLSLAIAGTSAALPPGETRFRDGANHHVGDDSFVARFGRAPARGDTEAVRMRAHLEYIRERLAAAPPARPELAARRAELLGYLGDYIAKGTTPQSTQLPWRTPVFIDEFGNVCAVGYLIERSAGRALPERIARLHRFDFLEDIAAAMPEVRAWVASSGFTLDELASIQPGYTAEIDHWMHWDVAGKVRPPDGAYAHDDEARGIVTRGAFRRGQMDGAWSQQAVRDGHVIGAGTLRRGAGTWRSFYADGKPLARGPFAASLPHGAWTFFHRSGHVAAEGRFERGVRAGAWQFYYDTAEKAPIATGAFRRGAVTGRWEHFDAAGKRIAVSSNATPAAWGDASFGGHLLEVTPYKNGLTHTVHSGNIAGDDWMLEGYFLGDERLYVRHPAEGIEVYDASGHLLRQRDGAWVAADCHWSQKRKEIARAGDITTLHGLLYRDAREGLPACGAATPVTPARARQIERVLAEPARTPSPEFVKAEFRRRGDYPFVDEPEPGQKPYDESLETTLRASIGWYIEFPHVDGRFIQVFHTLPGYSTNEIAFAEE